MRLNKYLAAGSALSRRAADTAIDLGRVTVDGKIAVKGTEVQESSQVKLDGKLITPRQTHITLLCHKPVGYVCSRNGQGSRTIFELLPSKYQHLQPVGRLDKDSSGLLLLTDDGELANHLTHPRYAKTKVYVVTLSAPLQPLHQQFISDTGVMLQDGLSQFPVTKLEQKGKSRGSHAYEVVMHEGRNRQIRRTFAALGYNVTGLHRTQFGAYTVDRLTPGTYRVSE